MLRYYFLSILLKEPLKICLSSLMLTGIQTKHGLYSVSNKNIIVQCLLISSCSMNISSHIHFWLYSHRISLPSLNFFRIVNKINEKVGHHIQLFLCPPEIDYKKLRLQERCSFSTCNPWAMTFQISITYRVIWWVSAPPRNCWKELNTFGNNLSDTTTDLEKT